jgi:hypothetical protein
MSDRDPQTSARDGWITLVASLALWLTLLALFLGVGHLLATSMAQGH